MPGSGRKGFQDLPFAKRIRAEAKIKTAVNGIITDVAQADEIVMRVMQIPS